MEYKYKVGDKVKIVNSGDGYSKDCLGEIVEILSYGTYFREPGYKTTKTIGDSNTNSGYVNEMGGECSFELIESCNPHYEIY